MSEQNIESVRSILEKVAENRDAVKVEEAVVAIDKVGAVKEFTPALVRLLEATWHYKHEDIVLILQELKDARAVDALYRTALIDYEYLNHDEFFGLARKCTWALADIGTEEAKTKLELLAGSDNENIRGYAKKRLDNWIKELHRKGP